MVLHVLIVGVSHGAATPVSVATGLSWMKTARCASIIGILESPPIIEGIVDPLVLAFSFDSFWDQQIVLPTFGATLLVVAPVLGLPPRPRFSGTAWYCHDQLIH